MTTLAVGLLMLLALACLTAQHVFWSGREQRTLAACNAFSAEAMAKVDALVEAHAREIDAWRARYESALPGPKAPTSIEWKRLRKAVEG